VVVPKIGVRWRKRFNRWLFLEVPKNRLLGLFRGCWWLALHGTRTAHQN